MADDNFQPERLITLMRSVELAPHVNELRERALCGDPSAEVALGYIYFRGGYGVPRNYAEALKWYLRVKREDDLTGFVASQIATIFYRGLGVEKNHQLAAKYLRRAALRGDGTSRVLFAILQKKGDGTLRKPRASERIFRASVSDARLSVPMRLLALMWLAP